MTVRVGVLGAGGRMGRAVCAAIDAAEGLELCCAVDRSGGETVAAGAPLRVATAPSALLDAGAEVAVEFTTAEAAVEHLSFLADAGIHAVSGTTGLPAAFLERLAERLQAPGSPNAVIAANFSISAVLMQHLAALAAPYFDQVEIVELHHDEKADAPSGTAVATAEAIASARAAAGAGALRPDPTRTLTLPGARGATGAAGIHVHAVRLPGLIAHQEVLFGALGQGLTIRQDTYDRSSFMPGVLLAIEQVRARPGLTVGLAALLGL